MIAFRFANCSECLFRVRAHRNLRHIDIAVSHRNLREVFFLDCLTGSREFCDCADRCGFGCLTACIGIYLGIEYHDVDVFAGRDDVIQTAVTDIVSPAVAAENPHGWFGQQVGVFNDVFRVCIGICKFLRFLQQNFSGCSGGFAVVHRSHPCLCRYADSVIQSFDCGLQLVSSRIDGGCHTETEFRVILEQGICPCRTSALFVDGIRCRRSRSAPNRGATCRVRDEHAVTE